MKSCGLCTRNVFPAEATAAFGKVWHNRCFICSVPSCGKLLDSLTACEHHEALYCQHCYTRNVGSQRSYHGLRPTVTHASWSEEAAYSYRVYDDKKHVRTQVETINDKVQSAKANKIAAVAAFDSNVAEIRKCPKCDKTVYEAEKISAAGQLWHKNTCFTCTNCSKRLESRSLCERKGKLFCNVCYGKHFGPRIYGHGSAFINVL